MKFRFDLGVPVLVTHLPEILNSTDFQEASDMLESGRGVLISHHSIRSALFPDVHGLALLIQEQSLQNLQDARATKGKQAEHILQARIHLHNLTFHDK